MKLGDAVHFVAQPVAKTVDLVFKTSLATCQSCAERREKLNKISGIEIMTIFTRRNFQQNPEEATPPSETKK